MRRILTAYPGGRYADSWEQGVAGKPSFVEPTVISTIEVHRCESQGAQAARLEMLELM